MLQQFPTFKATTTIIVCIGGQHASVVWFVAELPKFTGLWLRCSLLEKNRKNEMGFVFYFNFLAGFHSLFQSMCLTNLATTQPCF